uniref:replication protein A 70 kDa DNA-binding subunit A-like n=1 Tax=Erigeron canadensis TaxID=72917 RepID=UPI001CB919C0|nr:replication protein A 70 kDa DNA-binding subunit A-like [Erigeron canadensis]
MATNQTLLVEQLDASKDFINTKVRIIRRWINPWQRLEMVLVDEKGAKIQCMVKKDLVPIFDNLIKEDTAVIIKRFGVGVNDDPFPVVKHKLKLSFYKSIEVQHGVTFTGPAYGFSFTPFNEINVTKARDKDTLNIDVIGCVTWCGNLEVFKSATNTSKRFNMELKDLDGVTQRCTLWNDYAVQLNDFVENNKSEEHVITIMQHAIINEWNENLTVQSDKFSTRIFINEDIQEANDFRRRLILKEGAAQGSHITFTTQTVYPNRLEFILNRDKKQLDEVREAEQPGDVVVVATIAMLEPQFGWFFIACKKCSKKVISKMEYLEIADEEELTDELINAPGDSIWCRKEKKIATEVGPKFRVTMRVQDSTGIASFVMWDRDVQKLLGLSAYDIRQRQLNNNDDETYPYELEGLLNVKVAFKIKIDKYNVKHKGSAYTVNKMCDDPDIIAELEDEENDNEVQQQEAMLEIVLAVKLAEESQGGPDSKDAFSVTGDSLAAEIEKDCETSPLQKRPNDTPGVESTSKSGKRVRKAKIY